MGAKDWMLMYADSEIRPILQSAPPVDRQATEALVRRLYPGHRVTGIEDGTLFEHANPPDDHVYAVWAADGTLQRSLSLAPDAYPFPFHPLELAEEALRALFGFNYEGFYQDDAPDLDDIVLAGFTVHS